MAEAGPRDALTCAICGATAAAIGSVHSSFSERDFELAHCPVCHYSFVIEPRTDFEFLYDGRYYRGDGADPTVDYELELDDPRTTRAYEWCGIQTIVEHLEPSQHSIRWLDFGCGLGGLVRSAREQGIDIVGFDQGYAARRERERGIPTVDRQVVDTGKSAFDVVTAIEVLEHLVDPMTTLHRIARLLRPGGALFVTTGNAAPFRGRLEKWSYVQPDVHVGYFEPDTLATAFRRVGLVPSTPGFVPGFADVIRYRVLKRLGVRRRNVLEQIVPWSIAARVVDRRIGVTAQPIGRKD
jgi:SAM-dependent methyltransferase